MNEATRESIEVVDFASIFCPLITRRAAPTQHIRHTSLFLESYIIPEYVNGLRYSSQKCEKSNWIHLFFAEFHCMVFLWFPVLFMSFISFNCFFILRIFIFYPWFQLKRVNSAGFGGRNCLSQMKKREKMSGAFRVFLPPMLLILLAPKVWRIVSEKVNGNELWNLDSSRLLGRNDRNDDEIRFLRVIWQQKSLIEANPNAMRDNTDEVGTIDCGVLRVRSWLDQMRDLIRS